MIIHPSIYLSIHQSIHLSTCESSEEKVALVGDVEKSVAALTFFLFGREEKEVEVFDSERLVESQDLLFLDVSEHVVESFDTLLLLGMQRALYDYRERGRCVPKRNHVLLGHFVITYLSVLLDVLLDVELPSFPAQSLRFFSFFQYIARLQ